MDKFNNAQKVLVTTLMDAFGKYDSLMRSEHIKQGMAKRKQRLSNDSKNSDGLLHQNKPKATIDVRGEQ